MRYHRCGPGRVAVVVLLTALIGAPYVLPQEPADPAEGLRVKSILIEGLKRTREHVVRRELIQRVGEPYRAASADRERTRLERLNLFVDIKIEPVVAGGEVVLTYRFVEILRFLPSLSVQITDENGIAVGVGIKVPNVQGRGVAFSGRVMGGGSALGQIVLQNPWFAGNRIGYSLEYYYRDRQNLVADFLETSHELLLDVNAPIGEYFRFGGRFEYQDIRSDRDGVTLAADNEDQAARLGIYLDYDSRDAYVGTHRGWWAEIRAAKDLRFFPDGSSFTQLDLDIRRYQPLPFGDRHTLGLYGLLTVRSGAVGTDVAPWQLFGMGGTNTVRGWDYATWVGKNQLIGTVEYTYTLIKPRLVRLPFGLRYRGGLQVCLFGDVGSTWDHTDEFDAHVLKGWGLGLRLLVPIVGVVRFDLAWGGGAAGPMFHIGSYEKAFMARKRVR